jgi:hypothetical protein
MPNDGGLPSTGWILNIEAEFDHEQEHPPSHSLRRDQRARYLFLSWELDVGRWTLSVCPTSNWY